MDLILVFVLYNEVFNDDNIYNNFLVVGVDVDRGCHYNGMKLLVSQHVKINETEQAVVMKYQLQYGSPPIPIDSDGSLEFYKKLKTTENDYAEFSVCTSIIERRQPANKCVSTSTQRPCLGGIDAGPLQSLRVALLTGSVQTKFSIVEFANGRAADSMVKDVDQLRTTETMMESQIVDIPINKFELVMCS